MSRLAPLLPNPRVLWVLVALVVVGCAPAAPRAGPAPDAAASGGVTGAGLAPAPVTAPATPSVAPPRLRLAYSELNPSGVVPWTAREAGIFAKHGLDVELAYIASSQTVPAVLAGDTDIALGGGYAALNSHLAGSDLQIIFGVVNWFPFELVVASDVTGAADLRGRTLGVSRFGSSSDVATRVALERLGLQPERDVTIVQSGSLNERIAAMQAGAVAGGMSAAPDTLRLRRLGFTSLLDLAETGEQEMTTVAFASAAWLRANDAAVQAFVDAMIEGIYYAKTNPPVAERVLGQYLKIDDPELLADAYAHFVGRPLATLPDPGTEAARRYLARQAAADPRAAGAAVDDFFDLRFVERAGASGVLERLYGQASPAAP
jgi:NitT/TauT family transport system substrate-binding protein